MSGSPVPRPSPISTKRFYTCRCVYSAKAGKELAEKYEVEMPIIAEVNKVLFEGKSASEAVIDLMVRDKKVETPMLPWNNETE